MAAAAVGIALAVRGGDESAAAAGWLDKPFPSQGDRHVAEERWTKFKYNSTPPTSGPHDNATAVWSTYTEPVGQGHLIHNLEHGGIIVQYGDDVPANVVTQIDEWYRDDPNGIVVAPLPKLGDKIALTAWTHLRTCERFDEDAFSQFRDAYRAKGPEPFELEQLQPGSQ